MPMAGWSAAQPYGENGTGTGTGGAAAAAASGKGKLRPLSLPYLQTYLQLHTC